MKRNWYDPVPGRQPFPHKCLMLRLFKKQGQACGGCRLKATRIKLGLDPDPDDYVDTGTWTTYMANHVGTALTAAHIQDAANTIVKRGYNEPV